MEPIWALQSPDNIAGLKKSSGRRWCKIEDESIENINIIHSSPG